MGVVVASGKAVDHESACLQSEGFNSPSKSRYIASYINKCHFDIIGILKTQVASKKVAPIFFYSFGSRKFFMNYDFSPLGQIWLL